MEIFCRPDTDLEPMQLSFVCLDAQHHISQKFKVVEQAGIHGVSGARFQSRPRDADGFVDVIDGFFQVVSSLVSVP